MSRDLSGESLAHRLENWGSAGRGAYDPVDAARMTAAWRTLPPRYRELLRMVYLWHADREVVCRRLRIARRPLARFDGELAAAHAALAWALAAPDQRAHAEFTDRRPADAAHLTDQRRKSFRNVEER